MNSHSPSSLFLCTPPNLSSPVKPALLLVPVSPTPTSVISLISPASSATITPATLSITRKTVRAKRSSAWAYFQQPTNANSFDVTCNLCNNIINRTTGATTTLFHRLKLHHNSEYQAAKESMVTTRKNDPSFPLVLDGSQVTQLTQVAVCLFMNDLLPSSIIESPRSQAIFQHFLDSL
ncbi:unnamed protein product [Didymodactylos carnosus]|uniref:BED-type domain-containing protein n=1 Tax=Didymodactylos carnosus TaxID=1234261 RepID=A0A815S6H6_9BILA|nr:unnamed protein product [Didymodactylos carnosus]CAF1486063.1 unnamed protein product [Didymodactylos carnosus]CAF3765719.1 unnamed protein product [Didymodactylos carnosus]CAF4350067.1 unnamed protein product [Didymodactylos carnosus]